MEKYDDRFGLPTDPGDVGSGAALNEGLEAIGRAFRMYGKLQRCAELRGKAALLPSEAARLACLQEELAREFPQLVP